MIHCRTELLFATSFRLCFPSRIKSASSEPEAAEWTWWNTWTSWAKTLQRQIHVWLWSTLVGMMQDDVKTCLLPEHINLISIHVGFWPTKQNQIIFSPDLFIALATAQVLLKWKCQVQLFYKRNVVLKKNTYHLINYYK